MSIDKLLQFSISNYGLLLYIFSTFWCVCGVLTLLNAGYITYYLTRLGRGVVFVYMYPKKTEHM